MPDISRKDQEARIAAYRRNGYNVAATARELGIHRDTMRGTIRGAIVDGVLSDEEVHEQNPVKAEQFVSAKSKLIAAHQKKRAKGDWRKYSHMHIGPGPFILGMFGDKHSDNPGCDVEALSRDWERLDPVKRTYGIFLGDEFDNWPRVMGHLWRDNLDPEDAWIYYEYMMEQHGPGVLALITGNHDQFTNAPVDPLQMLCEANGVLYRRSGMHLRINAGEHHINVAARHIWRGNSQYSSAHALKRAAQFGHVDADIIAGAHIHQGELRKHVRASDARIMHLCQVSSYKVMDNYANDRGFMSETTPPCVWYVCRPELDVTDHRRVTGFYDYDEARAFYEAIT